MTCCWLCLTLSLSICSSLRGYASHTCSHPTLLFYFLHYFDPQPKTNIAFKVPLFYLVDSILRNVGGIYCSLFSSHLLIVFRNTFSEVKVFDCQSACLLLVSTSFGVYILCLVYVCCCVLCMSAGQQDGSSPLRLLVVLLGSPANPASPSLGGYAAHYRPSHRHCASPSPAAPTVIPAAAPPSSSKHAFHGYGQRQRKGEKQRQRHGQRQGQTWRRPRGGRTAPAPATRQRVPPPQW